VARPCALCVWTHKGPPEHDPNTPAEPLRDVVGIHTMHLVSETRLPVQRDRFLRMPELTKVTGLQRSTLYRLMRDGQFVQAVKITPRCTAWPESLVLAWVQDRIAASIKAAPSGGQQR
jgi:prophage regulatory protein